MRDRTLGLSTYLLQVVNAQLLELGQLTPARPLLPRVYV
jgi:hypothetical protein